MMATFGGWCASWPSGQSALSESLSSAGKPVAMKVAQPVWAGGKAERPYLSLLTSERHTGFSPLQKVAQWHL